MFSTASSASNERLPASRSRRRRRWTASRRTRHPHPRRGRHRRSDTRGTRAVSLDKTSPVPIRIVSLRAFQHLQPFPRDHFPRRNASTCSQNTGASLDRQSSSLRLFRHRARQRVRGNHGRVSPGETDHARRARRRRERARARGPRRHRGRRPIVPSSPSLADAGARVSDGPNARRACVDRTGTPPRPSPPRDGVFPGAPPRGAARLSPRG